MNCTDWNTQSQYSTLPESKKTVIAHKLTTNYQTIQGIYTVPNNNDAWFLQGTLQFLNNTEYDISEFSIQRTKQNNNTKDFNLYLSGHWYNHTGILYPNDIHEFHINPTHLGTADGIINLTAKINGNHDGMIHIIYTEPILLTRNAQFTITNNTQTSLNLTLTKTLTRTPTSPLPKQLITDYLHTIKNNQPTNPLYHFLCFLNQLKSTLQHPYTARFKMIPYATSEIYKNITINSNDYSIIRHTSPNGNIWFTSSLPTTSSPSINIQYQISV